MDSKYRHPFSPNYEKHPNQRAEGNNIQCCTTGQGMLNPKMGKKDVRELGNTFVTKWYLTRNKWYKWDKREKGSISQPFILPKKVSPANHQSSSSLCWDPTPVSSQIRTVILTIFWNLFLFRHLLEANCLPLFVIIVCLPLWTNGVFCKYYPIGSSSIFHFIISMNDLCINKDIKCRTSFFIGGKPWLHINRALYELFGRNAILEFFMKRKGALKLWLISSFCLAFYWCKHGSPFS